MSGHVKSHLLEPARHSCRHKHDEQETGHFLDDRCGDDYVTHDDNGVARCNPALAGVAFLCLIARVFLCCGLANTALSRAAPKADAGCNTL